MFEVAQPRVAWDDPFPVPGADLYIETAAVEQLTGLGVRFGSAEGGISQSHLGAASRGSNGPTLDSVNHVSHLYAVCYWYPLDLVGPLEVCLSPRYVGSNTKLRWRCAEGHEWDVTPHAMKLRVNWCTKCPSVT